MSLTPEQKDVLDSAIRRRVAVATLKNLHRQLENEAREEAAGQRFAGAAIGMVLGGLALVVAYLVVPALFEHLQTGVSSSASRTSEALKIACYMALIIGTLAVAVYLCLGYRGSAIRFTTVAVATITIAVVFVAALYYWLVPVSGCRDGWLAANRNELDRAVAELTACLAFPRLTTAARAHALQTRAWVYYKRKEYASAIQDAEAGFELAPPKQERDLMPYAVALRRMGRLDDSLQALAHAEQLAASGTSIAIQRERGLILVQLGRYEEAVSAFNLILSSDEFTPQAYWWRGLAYEGMGKAALARADYEKCVQLLSAKSNLPPELAELLPKVLARLEATAPVKK
jgi:tetratricopeptide (TPR) repeat protein